MKLFFIILGFISMGLGCVGVILPILPTTPFLLLASFCFAKGSTRFHIWFTNTNLYKNHLENFVKTRAMTLRTKVTLLAFASTMLLIGFIMSDVLIARIIIAFLFIFKYYYFIFRIKTLKVGDLSIDDK